jgi:hypothetical protein
MSDDNSIKIPAEQDENDILSSRDGQSYTEIELELNEVIRRDSLLKYEQDMERIWKWTEEEDEIVEQSCENVILEEGAINAAHVAHQKLCDAQHAFDRAYNELMRSENTISSDAQNILHKLFENVIAAKNASIEAVSYADFFY